MLLYFTLLAGLLLYVTAMAIEIQLWQTLGNQKECQERMERLKEAQALALKVKERLKEAAKKKQKGTDSKKP